MSMDKTTVLVAVAVISLGSLLFPARGGAVTYVVDGLGDGVLSGDTNPGDGICSNPVGNCQFRTALEEANARIGLDSLEFSVAGVIEMNASAGAFPAITDQVIIFGNTAPGYPGFDLNLEQAPPAVYLSGDGTTPGLVFDGAGAAGSLVFALGVVDFNDGIQILQGADNVNIHGCYIGVDDDGTAASNTGRGILIQSDGNIIGRFIAAGTPQEYGNVISGNGGHGISLVGASDNRISGNRIGTHPDGSMAVANGGNGIDVRAPLRAAGGVSDWNWFGEIDADDGIGNVIAGNAGDGIYANAANTRILGNRIGVGLNGLPVGNGGNGISILGAGSIIGVGQPHARNVVANNATGILVQGQNNTITNNLVGFGSPLQGNSEFGIQVTGSQFTMISDNHVLLADAGGIRVADGMEETVSGNVIGVFYDGGSPMDAGGADVGGAGIMMENVEGASVQLNTVGFYANGIVVLGGDPSIGGNHIGIDSQDANIGNSDAGIVLKDTANATLGLNRIVHNGLGVVLAGDDSGSMSSLVLENLIARNAGVGVQVGAGDEGPLTSNLNNEIVRNSIYANGSIGIDLGGDGMTFNDVDDVDIGDNNLQNYPEVFDVSVVGPRGVSVLEVTWQMDSSPVNTLYPVEAHFYLADESGDGEGRVYLGSDSVTSPGSMQMSGLTLPTDISGGWLVATATDEDGNTSEFSPVVEFGDPLFTDGFEGI